MEKPSFLIYVPLMPDMADVRVGPWVKLQIRGCRMRAKMLEHND